MEISLLTLSLVVGLFVLAYRYLTKNYFYFADKPIPSMKPTILFGNAGPLLMKKVDLFEHFRNIYDTFPNARIFGTFNLRQPAYVVRDPDVAKQITVKDFDHFADHMKTGLESDDDNGHNDLLLTNSLVSLRGQKWRDMRATLSPAFTGSKMRQMFSLIAECGQSMVTHFRAEEQKAIAGGASGLQLEMKDVMQRFANDVIGTAAFGIKVDSYRDPNNEFITMARSVTDRKSPMKVLKTLGFAFAPKLMLRLNIDLLTPEEDRFFRQTILETMRTREEKGIFRPDMIQLLMQAKKGSLRHAQKAEEAGQPAAEGFATVDESQVGRRAHDRVWTDTELVSQAFIFFFAGLETISWTLSFALHELAVAEDVQQRLFEEIRGAEETLEEGKSLTYEQLQALPYLDNVISETLRKWPIGLVLNRECIRDYHYDDGKGTSFTMEKGAVVFIPIIGLHYDPKYFPNPERFDPDRFSVENRKNIQNGTYLPFGAGPRNCIGSRFALMEAKAVLYYLLLNFSVLPCEKTQIPLKLKKSSAEFATEKGVWLEFQSRKR